MKTKYYFEFHLYRTQASNPKTTLGSQAAMKGSKFPFMEKTDENLPTSM